MSSERLKKNFQVCVCVLMCVCKRVLVCVCVCVLCVCARAYVHDNTLSNGPAIHGPSKCHVLVMAQLRTILESQLCMRRDISAEVKQICIGPFRPWDVVLVACNGADCATGTRHLVSGRA